MLLTQMWCSKNIFSRQPSFLSWVNPERVEVKVVLIADALGKH